MGASENKALIEQYFQKISSGDPSVPDAFADGITWWVPPGSDMAGLYEGKAAVLEMFAKGIGLYTSPHGPSSKTWAFPVPGETFRFSVPAN